MAFRTISKVLGYYFLISTITLEFQVAWGQWRSRLVFAIWGGGILKEESTDYNATTGLSRALVSC